MKVDMFDKHHKHFLKTTLLHKCGPLTIIYQFCESNLVRRKTVKWKPMVMRPVFCFYGLLLADSDPFLPEGCICTVHQPAWPAEARPSIHGQHLCLHTRQMWSLTSFISGAGFIRLGLVCFDLLIGLEAYSYSGARKSSPATDKSSASVLVAADVVMWSRKPHKQLECQGTNIF